MECKSTRSHDWLRISNALSCDRLLQKNCATVLFAKERGASFFLITRMKKKNF
jgi:hypothetical protein